MKCLQHIGTVAVLLFFMNAGSFSNAQTPVQAHGALQVTGTFLTDAQGNKVVLRGMSLGWHNWWPRFYNAGTVQWLYSDWGITIVRAALGVEPEGAYLDKPEWSLQKMEAVIDAAISTGIYVIIDWHCHHIRLEEAKAFFTRMAKKYGSYPNILYEIFNEPEYDSWHDVKAYSIELIRTIRAVDKKNIILVGTPHWDQDIHLAAADSIQGFTNIMYTLHFYAASHKQRLRSRADSALHSGLPLFISESAGMKATGNGPINEVEWEKWLEWAEQHSISWVTWSVADKNETCSVLKPSASSEGGWKEEDLKPSGIMVRQYLRKMAGKK